MIDLLGDSPESLLGYPNWWAERIHHSEIGIAILDVVMPKMDGVEAFQMMRQIKLELPVFFHAGYGANMLVVVRGFA